MRRGAKRLAEMKELESVSDCVYCYLTCFLIFYINLLRGAGDGRGGKNGGKEEGKTGEGESVVSKCYAQSE